MHASYAATIDWGDGSSSAGTVSLSGGVYTVTGTHTYQEEGVFAIATSIQDDSASAIVHTTATMQEELLPGGTRGTANDRFISEIYRELLGRAVDAGGLALWSRTTISWDATPIRTASNTGQIGSPRMTSTT